MSLLCDFIILLYQQMAQYHAIQSALKFMRVSVSWLRVEVVAQGPTCLARPQLKSNVLFSFFVVNEA